MWLVLVVDWVPASFLVGFVRVIVITSLSSSSSSVASLVASIVVATLAVWRVEDIHDSLWGVWFVDTLDDAISDIIGSDDFVR